MKKPLHILTLLLLFSFNGMAQQQGGTEREIEANGRTFQQIFDSLTVGLIKSRIPYSYLYNRVYPWSQLDAWKDKDTTNMHGLFQSWRS